MPDKKTEITYRQAKPSDVQKIREFVDYWLSGRAKAKGIAGGGNDYFVSIGQHRSYLRTCYVLLAECDGRIVGWAVKERTNVLIHLLVDALMRGRGIGKEMLKRLKPDIIRSKSDQLTGDPASFYEKYGYVKIGKAKTGKKNNIDFMVKSTSKKPAT